MTKLWIAYNFRVSKYPSFDLKFFWNIESILSSLLLFSGQVTFDSLWPCGLQHASSLCPPLSPAVHSSSCVLSWWCCLTVSSPATLFFAFNLSQHQGLFHWVGCLHQVARVWGFCFSISPTNEYSQLISFRIDSLLSKGLSRVSSSTTVWKHQFFITQPFFMIDTRLLESVTVSTFSPSICHKWWGQMLWS